MGVQTYATERNSQVEIFIHFILEEFFSRLQRSGRLKDVRITSQKPYISDIASDVWDHFVAATQPNGRELEIWCQTTCYKGNGTGTPEPNKTYEVRETLVEGLTIREHFKKSKNKHCFSLHFTVGDSRYSYQWFLDLKAATYDKSIYIGRPNFDIFGSIADSIKGLLTEKDKLSALRSVATGTSELATFIKQSSLELDEWWNACGHATSEIANAQWELIAEEFRRNSRCWPELSNIRGQDIKGRVNKSIYSEELEFSDPLILKTASKLLSKNPFLSVAIKVLESFDSFYARLIGLIPASNNLNDFLVQLWNSPMPERLVIRRLLLRIHSNESVAYVQDRDVAGITEHNLYAGDHTAAQTRDIARQIQMSLGNAVAAIRTPDDLMRAVRARGKALVNQARWFEGKNGTELKPSFDYVELALEGEGFGLVSPSSAGIRAVGYHAEISSEVVRPYTNLKVVVNQSGKALCIIKAKYFRPQEFPRRCKEEAFVGLSLRFRYRDGRFDSRLSIPQIMFIDMPSDYSPPPFALKRLISFGWQVFFSTDDLIDFLRAQ
jgi:hypothetical protein